CTAYANDGGSAWNATTCADIAGERAPGESCTVVGSGTAGKDDCALGAMCWGVDVETLEGTCVAFCEGSFEMPNCMPEGTGCFITNEGALNLCLPPCNPLVQDCPAGDGCYPLAGSYLCRLTLTEPEGGQEGDACEYSDRNCQPGLLCLDAELDPTSCNGASSCCAPTCDLTAPDCSAPMAECVAIYETPWPGEESYGVCRLPAP
ncbi:MAG: ribulose phosphate epimerase, partial [Nannocystaceae bacterium]